ncbi:MAG: cyclic nucleotide-binding domain-containing protein [Planctomycetota bacterium]
MDATTLNTNPQMRRPMRWDQPLDPNMSDSTVEQLMRTDPFAQMDPDSFRAQTPLRGILKNDCQIHHLQQGDIIVREGDYGGSAFFILEGKARVSLKQLPPEILGRQTPRKQGWLEAFVQGFRNSKHPEVRDYSRKTQTSTEFNQRQEGSTTRVFLQDIPRVIPLNQSVSLVAGELFGEISALTRTPRSATVVADSEIKLLEIRWQGIREFMKQNEVMRDHITDLYRENSLRSHLREMELLNHVSADAMDRLVQTTGFESFGKFQWNQKFESTLKKDIAERILSEPVIAEQGTYVNGIILIRNGFARISRNHGQGHQTIGYASKGKMFGLRELAHTWKTGQPTPWLLSLRAVGYVDILRIPAREVEDLILPSLPESKMPPPIANPNLSGEKRRHARPKSMDRGLMEFLVERRLINGTKAMMIDLDRCTRCDDCVRACASTHNNNPRFNRQGPIHDHWMISQACMHCLDPVCMIGCPTGAIARDPESGNVSINDTTCIGCSTCANSCPYNNIQMVSINNPQGQPIHDTDTGQPIVKATKCDFCESHAGGPACQRACPHDALVRIDLSTPQSVTQWSQR